MLIDFFYTLRSAKLPVSVHELLSLLEALKAGVVGPNGDPAMTGEGAWKIDDFYFLSRAVMVKDEKHYDKFDRAFGAYFKGVEMVADFTKDIPLEWLRKNLELQLSRHFPIWRQRLQPAGHTHRPGKRAQPQRRQGLGPASLQGLRRHTGIGHPQHQGGAAAPAQICPGRQPGRARS
jgi:hypothetical protein